MNYFDFATRNARAQFAPLAPREPEPDEARRIAANNDALVTAAIDRFFRDTEPNKTHDDVLTRGDRQ